MGVFLCIGEREEGGGTVVVPNGWNVLPLSWQLSAKCYLYKCHAKHDANKYHPSNLIKNMLRKNK